MNTDFCWNKKPPKSAVNQKNLATSEAASDTMGGFVMDSGIENATSSAKHRGTILKWIAHGVAKTLWRQARQVLWLTLWAAGCFLPSPQVLLAAGHLSAQCTKPKLPIPLTHTQKLCIPSKNSPKPFNFPRSTLNFLIFLKNKKNFCWPWIFLVLSIKQ